MGRDFILTNSSDNALGKRKKTVGRQIVIGPNAIKFVTVVIVAVLAIVYLSQSTAGASRSLKVREIEDGKAQLDLQKERLEAEQTRLKSLREIDTGVEKPILEPVTSIDHIGTQSNVAMN